MPEGHEIPVFEQEAKRGPGRPRKVAEVVEPIPVEEPVVPETPSRMVKIIIHPSEDGTDVNPLNVPDPNHVGRRLILPRNKEIEVDRVILRLLDEPAKIKVENQLELDKYGRPLTIPKEVRIRRCPYTIID